MSTKGPYPFVDKATQYKAYTDEMLAFAVDDAIKARDNMKGCDPIAECWYQDDASTIRAEIDKRAKRAARRSK